jgi:hypothetical protein
MFTTAAGNVVNPSSFNLTAWRPARARAGLAEGGTHWLRHYYASVLLAGGVDIRALSEYLGHHDPAITLRIYSHLMSAAEDLALRAVERPSLVKITARTRPRRRETRRDVYRYDSQQYLSCNRTSRQLFGRIFPGAGRAEWLALAWPAQPAGQGTLMNAIAPTARLGDARTLHQGVEEPASFELLFNA